MAFLWVVVMKSFLSFTFLDSTVTSGDAETKCAHIGKHEKTGMAAGFADGEG